MDSIAARVSLPSDLALLESVTRRAGQIAARRQDGLAIEDEEWRLMARLTALGVVCSVPNTSLADIVAVLPVAVLSEAWELAVMIGDAPALKALESRNSTDPGVCAPERSA